MADKTNFRAHHYRSADDRLDLFARDYPADGQGGLPLLMMHGLSRNSADFEPLAAHLKDDYRLVVADQRGRGRSAYDPDPANYNAAIYVDDMFALLDDLGIERAVLVGTSMGGLMSMLMASAQPERIAGIIINDIGPQVEADGLARLGTYVGQSMDMADWDEAARMCRHINAAAFPDFTDDDWLAFAGRTCEEKPDGGVRFAYDPAIAGGLEGSDPDVVPPDLWPLWEAMTPPLLLVRGGLSDLLTEATADAMGKRYGGEYRSVIVPNRGHAPLLNEPEALSAIQDFLSTVAG